MQTIKAVFFDFDETLVHAEPPVFDTFLPACEQVGLTFSNEQVKHAHRYLYEYFAGDGAMADYERLNRDLKRFHFELTTRVLVKMGVEESNAMDATQEGNLSVRLPEGHVSAPHAHRVLEALAAKGYALGVITNNHANIEARCEQQGFLKHLDTVVTRTDAGCSKPAPGIFQMALDNVGVRPGQSVYIGDNYFADVVGAQNVGMQAVLLDHHDVFPDAGCHVIPELSRLMEIV